MASTSSVLPAAKTIATPSPLARQVRRRRIDPQTGRALVILGHAIEYLADEFVYEGGTFTANRGQVDAIQLLMSLNREIYMSCPEAQTFGQWLLSFLRRESKQSGNAGALAPGLSHSRS